MVSLLIRHAIEEALSKFSEREVKITGSRDVGGGCINHAKKLETTAGDFFIKTNDASRFAGMFEAEARGLVILKSANRIRIPEVVAFGEADGESYLILEFIHPASRNKNFWKNFGAALAELHKISSARFGLDHDNFIGSLPQSNRFHDDWLSFFIEERLQKQVQLAFNNKSISEHHLKQFESLYKQLENFFPKEKPSLLHGDLWSGNFMTGAHGEACLIDPAVHYGHREAELAFTKLFGGFDADFYHAYHEAFPLQPGFEKRKALYNLYPLLVHVNLFGRSYLSDVESILKSFGGASFCV